jgi:UDP-N-acetylglucosamine:LPS N-acetylglucosamine transferase
MKIALVCANGGHLTEMQQLKSIYDKYDFFYITYKGKDSKHLRPVYYFKDFKLRICKITEQLFTSWYILIKEKPDMIISTGGLIALPVSLYAKLLKINIIFIDCGTNSEKPSGTGRVMKYLANIFLTQWPHMVAKYGGKAQYWGSLI